MTLSLEQTIERSYQAMTTHVEHALIPIYRGEIYHLLDPKAFKWLAIISARRVLPIWKSVQPADPTLEDLLDMAEGVINGTASINEARDEAGKAWEQLENFGSTREGIALGNVLYSKEAAIEALMEALGKNPFQEIVLTEHSTDSDLDPWCSDTAFCAVVACAGRIGNPKSDKKGRRKFWEWWLKEAIPTALKFSET